MPVSKLPALGEIHHKDKEWVEAVFLMGCLVVYKKAASIFRGEVAALLVEYLPQRVGCGLG